MILPEDFVYVNKRQPISCRTFLVTNWPLFSARNQYLPCASSFMFGWSKRWHHLSCRIVPSPVLLIPLQQSFEFYEVDCRSSTLLTTIRFLLNDRPTMWFNLLNFELHRHVIIHNVYWTGMSAKRGTLLYPVLGGGYILYLSAIVGGVQWESIWRIVESDPPSGLRDENSRSLWCREPGSPVYPPSFPHLIFRFHYSPVDVVPIDRLLNIMAVPVASYKTRLVAYTCITFSAMNMVICELWSIRQEEEVKRGFHW
jgi:hypothetical protein